MKEYGKILKGLYHSKIKGECVFCRIIEGKEDANIVYEDDNVIAFAPLKSGILARGHLLVVPKIHCSSILDIDTENLAEVMNTAKRIAQDLNSETDFDGFNILNANREAAQQSIDHFHLHLVPRTVDDNIDLWPETDYSEESYNEFYKEIEKSLE